MNAHGTRDAIVVQPGDVQYRDSQVEGRLDIRRVELSGFRRVLVREQHHTESPLDVRH